MTDLLYMTFSVSGVETWVFLPPLVAFIVSFLTSMGGVSGAFLLLPFQVSCLHFTSPSVSATNLVFNIVAIPSGVYRYIREGRMVWPLTLIVIFGTLPGVFIGYYVRVVFLPDPGAFKLFVGCVLLYIGIRLFLDLTTGLRTRRLQEGVASRKADDHPMERERERIRMPHLSSGLPAGSVVQILNFTMSRVEYEFWGERFSFSTPGMFLLSFIVGVVGGAYGIGGGAIIAPFCVTIFHLPIYTVAGAALMGTFLTSIAGVVFYSAIPAHGGLVNRPDWPLGLLFGAGGFIGMYCGARIQKFVPQSLIKFLLGLCISFVALLYIIQFFL